MTVITLRNAAPADVPDVLRLVRGLAEYEKLLHEVVITEADLHAALFGPQPRAYAVLAHAADSAVGLALWYYTFSTFRGRPDIFLEDLFVEPAHRGRGIGLALLRHLAQRAVAEHCRRVEWRVLNWNAPAIAFYESLGAAKMQDWQVRRLGGEALTALAQGAIHG
ncbi:MAG TPA: GNAT family N-acetyltransferase [Acetobacteraceae bacterium]|nr:GNAT family N-acetyltransferase [Acetobacteraceae bacterium]